MVISALCLVASNKQQIQWKDVEATRKFGNGQLLSRCRFILNIEPTSLSSDRRIKMRANKQTNKQTTKIMETGYIPVCNVTLLKSY